MMEKIAAENILAETRMTMELLFPAVKHDQIHPFPSLSGKQGNHETAGLVLHSKYQVIILIVTEVKPGEFIVSQITSKVPQLPWRFQYGIVWCDSICRFSLPLCHCHRSKCEICAYCVHIQFNTNFEENFCFCYNCPVMFDTKMG